MIPLGFEVGAAILTIAVVSLTISMVRVERQIQSLEGWIDILQAHLKMIDRLMEHEHDPSRL
jgi:hypothetical protein